jgi:cytochrome c
MKSRNDSIRRALVAAAALVIGTSVTRADDAAKPAAACDAARAERVATQCMICHTVGEDEGSSVGPGLWGMYGRKAASVPGFPYSKAFRALELSWTEAELDRFLTQPMAMVPGTMMAFAGLRDPADRAAIICRLKASR